jgi:hypothetical protein
MSLINDPCLTVEQQALRNLISEVSERCWYAGWLHDAEFDVWRLMTEGGEWGRCASGDLDGLLAEIRDLSERLGVWITWNDRRKDCDHEPVSLGAWTKRFEVWSRNRADAGSGSG